MPNGKPVGDNENCLTAGKYGPMLMQDTQYLEKIAQFDRERIPERAVHAKGSAAFGYFEVTDDIAKYTKAAVFGEIGKKTPVAVRFSTIMGERGTPDTFRDPRGFAVKFYSEEGNWDLLCIHTPTFFIRDPMKFPDLVHSQKRHPQTGVYDPDTYWDFTSLHPVSLHTVTQLFTDRGMPYSYRHMHGYGCHTFKFVNEKGEAYWVKFHLVTDAGIKNLTDEEAKEMNKLDPDFHRNDLFQHIDNGNEATWTLKIQLMPEKEGRSYKWNIFDVTKVWPHADYPLLTVGKLVLNRNPKNFFVECEQLAFSPGNLIPGIESSFDKLLIGRMMNYSDTQRHRLGKNYMQIPVNCPYRSKGVSFLNQDGYMNVTDNNGSRPNYSPNSFHPYKTSDRGIEHPISLDGLLFRHGQEDHPNDDFEQASIFYSKVLSAKDKQNLVKNLTIFMKYAKRHIQERQVRVFTKCHPEYGKRVAEELHHNIVAPMM